MKLDKIRCKVEVYFNFPQMINTIHYDLKTAIDLGKRGDFKEISHEFFSEINDLIKSWISKFEQYNIEEFKELKSILNPSLETFRLNLIEIIDEFIKTCERNKLFEQIVAFKTVRDLIVKDIIQDHQDKQAKIPMDLLEALSWSNGIHLITILGENKGKITIDDLEIKMNMEKIDILERLDFLKRKHVPIEYVEKENLIKFSGDK